MHDDIVEIDHVDREIITLLQANPRASYLELAQELGVSASTARRRTERLLSSNALKLFAIPAWPTVGMTLGAIIGVSVELSKLREVAAKLRSMDEVCWIGMTAGEYDFVGQIVLPRNIDLMPFVADRLGTIEGIRNVQTLVVSNWIKHFNEYRIQMVPDPLYSRTTGLHADFQDTKQKKNGGGVVH